MGMEVLLFFYWGKYKYDAQLGHTFTHVDYGFGHIFMDYGYH